MVTSPPSRSWPRWYDVRLCRCPISSASSLTCRSLRASSMSNCHRNGCPVRRRTLGGVPGVSRVWGRVTTPGYIKRDRSIKWNSCVERMSRRLGRLAESEPEPAPGTSDRRAAARRASRRTSGVMGEEVLGEFDPRVDAQLAEYPPKVAVDRVGRQEQGARRLLVGLALHDRPDDSKLGAGQAVPAGGGPFDAVLAGVAYAQ